jgi:glycosyltransferase involved in cell wall biosynthesis
MNSSPFISVVLPVYNAERYVFQATESILNQTYKDFELIIIDDGSTDHSIDVIRSFYDPRIVFIQNQDNQGLIYTLNRGIQSAKGKYIARMDADDISVAHRFQQQVSFLEMHPEIGVVGSGYLPIDENNKAVRSPVHLSEYPLTVKWLMLIGNPLAHPSTMYRADLARQVGGYDNRFTYAEDYEFWIRMAEVTAICSIKDVLIHYRESNNSRISRKHYSEQVLITNKIRQIAFNRLFNGQMTPAISAAIRGEGEGIITNQSRYEACLLLFESFKRLSAGSREISEKEKMELIETARNEILIIICRINSVAYFIKILIFPILFTRKQFVLSMFRRLTNYIKRKLGIQFPSHE